MIGIESQWDNELANRWASAHGIEIEGADNLCDQAFTCEENGSPVAIATVVKAGKIAFFENFLTAENLTVNQARKAAIILEEMARSFAKKNNCKQLVSLVQSKGVLRELEKLGFEQQGSPMAFMTKEVTC